MFNLGPAEIILILVVALLIFGPKKLPELGKSLGQGIREFRRGTSGLKEELESSFRDEPATPRPTSATPTPVVAMTKEATEPEKPVQA